MILGLIPVIIAAELIFCDRCGNSLKENSGAGGQYWIENGGASGCSGCLGKGSVHVLGHGR